MYFHLKMGNLTHVISIWNPVATTLTLKILMRDSKILYTEQFKRWNSKARGITFNCNFS